MPKRKKDVVCYNVFKTQTDRQRTRLFAQKMAALINHRENSKDIKGISFIEPQIPEEKR